MNKTIDTTILDNIIVGRVNPYIYAFSTPTAPYALKVGDTYRLVSKRLDEWKRHYPDLQKQFEHCAKIDGDRIFRDFAVHQYLVNEKKRIQLNPEDIENEYYSREFFKNATQEDLHDAIADIKESASKNDGRYKLYTSDRLPETYTYERGSSKYLPRPNQAKTIEKFCKAVEEGHSDLLMYAVMRFGKSFTAMCCATEIEAKIVVILSAKADVKEEWKKTVETHEKFNEFDFLNKDSLDEDNSIISNILEKGRRVAIFLTLQDLQGEKIKTRHEELLSKTLDLLIIDETHFGARAAEYGKVLKNYGFNAKQVEKELEDCETEVDLENGVKFFNSKLRLHLSGTPYRILMGDEFREEQIIAFYQFVDIVEDQKKWDTRVRFINYHRENLNKLEIDEWNNPYYGFPQMIRFAFHPNKSTIVKLNELKKRGATYAFSEFFRTNSITKSADNSHKEFKHKKEILELFQSIDGKKTDGSLLSFLNYDKIKDGKLCRHIVCVLPFRTSCDALESLIIDNSSQFLNLNEYEIINISGVEKQSLGIRAVKDKIRACEKEDKKTITLTVNRMLTGTTVEEWDTMLYFKDTASPQEYDQSTFRLQNQYIKTYEDEDKKLVKYNMKPQTLLVDFDPNRLFQMQVQKSLFYNVNIENRGNALLEERIKKELEISPVIHLNDNKLIQIKPSNIIDAIRHYSRNKSILDEAIDIPFDNKLLEIPEIRAIIESINPIDAKKGLEINSAEGDGTDLDVPPTSDDDNDDDAKTTSSKQLSTEQPNDDKILEKKLAAYYTRILFYAFLTKSELIDLEQVIESISVNEENQRIARNVGVQSDILNLIVIKSSPFIRTHLDCKIQNINALQRDEELTPLERASVAMKKFARVSDTEVVMPENVADDLVTFIPTNELSEESTILDLASKQGELAVALYKRFNSEYPKLKNNIYSITTSPLAYELTRKVYESLNMPLDNVMNFISVSLIGEKKEELMLRLKKLKPTVILAGPPYQKNDGGGRGDSGSAIYHKFYAIAKELNPQYIAMFLKASWYSGGKGIGLPEFRKSMLDDKRISILHDYPDPTIYFNSPVTLRGGVCTFLWDSKHTGNCSVYNHINKDVFEQVRSLRTLQDEDILIRYNAGEDILKDILNRNEQSLGNEVYPRNAFKLESNNNFVKQKSEKDSKFKVYLPKGKIGYISELNIPRYIDKKSLINEWKVIVAKASPGDDTLPHSIISQPIISEPGSLCTDSHLLVRVVKNKKEAEILVGYMKTKFFRFMMLLAKNNHNMNRDVFRYVPMQDLSETWTDDKLYTKYGIENTKREFIDSVIKERS